MYKLYIILLLTWSVVYASSNTPLEAFMANASTIKANFTQTITSGTKVRTTNGTLEISRPNKFRWEYPKEGQLIISDAKKIYIYDAPLKQLTIKHLVGTIDESPAKILAGSSNLSSTYKITKISDNTEHLSWFSLQAIHNKNEGFNEIAIAIDKENKISIMRFRDNFGNRSVIYFSKVQTGIKLPAKDFEFSPPINTDIIEQ